MRQSGPSVVGERRTKDGSRPLIDGMLDLRLQDRPLSDLEIADNLMCAFGRGIETLPKVVATGLIQLGRHPDQLAAVRSDVAANVAVAFREINRFCGPTQWFGRTARRPTVVAGRSVRPGQRVIYLLQSAARNEREFYDPDAFRWNRENKRELSFGRGQKFCIGAHLAGLEGRVLLEEFLTRVADYDIDTAAAVRESPSFQWGWNPLPVRIRRVDESTSLHGRAAPGIDEGAAVALHDRPRDPDAATAISVLRRTHPV